MSDEKEKVLKKKLVPATAEDFLKALDEQIDCCSGAYKRSLQLFKEKIGK